ALRWRGDTSALSQSQLSRRLAAGGPVALRGPRLGSAHAPLTLVAHDRGSAVAVSLVVALADGTFGTVALGAAVPGTTTLHGSLPGRLAGGRLVAVEI